MTDFDFDSMSLTDLDNILSKAQAARSKKVEARRAELLAELAELDRDTPASPSKVTRTRVKSAERLYQDDKGNSWKGFGPIPQWLKDAEAAGRGRSEFRVK